MRHFLYLVITIPTFFKAILISAFSLMEIHSELTELGRYGALLLRDEFSKKRREKSLILQRYFTSA